MDTRPFVADQSAISPFLGGIVHWQFVSKLTFDKLWQTKRELERAATEKMSLIMRLAAAGERERKREREREGRLVLLRALLQQVCVCEREKEREGRLVLLCASLQQVCVCERERDRE